MEIQLPMFMALHIIVGDHNVVSRWLELIYISILPTHYYLESSGHVAYMGTHPNSGSLDLILLTIFNKIKVILHHQVDIIEWKKMYKML